jgi:hypothetical protein
VSKDRVAKVASRALVEGVVVAEADIRFVLASM